MTTQERRNFYRVDQSVIFEYRNIDVHTAENGDPEACFGDDTSMQLIMELRRVDKEAQKTLKIISDKQHLLADYLQRLNSKIDLIARHSMFTSNKENQSQKLNLSEGGVAFECSRALYKGNYLVLRLIFLPSYLPVIVFAKVIRCQSDGDCHKVAAKFHNLTDNNRQVLTRQVLKAQVMKRKESAKHSSKRDAK